jgi:hypothetical protein
MVCSLALLLVPYSSQFLLWLEPVFNRGGIGEWIMLWVYMALPAILLGVFWRGKMKDSFSFRSEYPTFLMLMGFHFCDIFFTIVGGFEAVGGFNTI